MHKVNQSDVTPKGLPGRQFRELVSHRAMGATGVSLRFVDVTPVSVAGPRCPHSHPGMEEVIYVQSGGGVAWVEGETQPLRAGDVVYVPAGQRHMMVNTTDASLTLLCAFSEPDPEHHYVEYPEIRYPA